MKIEVCRRLENGELLSVNEKGCEEIELDINLMLTNFSTDSKSRLIGIAKMGVFKMTKKSWTELKKFLFKSNQLVRFGY